MLVVSAAVSFFMCFVFLFVIVSDAIVLCREGQLLEVLTDKPCHLTDTAFHLTKPVTVDRINSHYICFFCFKRLGLSSESAINEKRKGNIGVDIDGRQH